MQHQKCITLNGGPAGRAGWKTVLRNEKHDFSADWGAAQKGGAAGCTTGRASGLHIKAGYTVRLSWAAEKSRPEGFPFLRAGGLSCSAVRAALFRSPPAYPSVFCAARRKFTFFVWKHGSRSRPALQLVLSPEIAFKSKEAC